MSGELEKRLHALGFELPPAPPPAATYAPFVIEGNMLYISGQLPMTQGAVTFKGKVGKDLTLEQGQEAARLCALNILAQVKVACNGDFSRIKKCVRVGGFVNAPDDYVDHPKVINGASEFFIQVLGEEMGRHARAAVGVGSLPLNAAVEVEALFSLI